MRFLLAVGVVVGRASVGAAGPKPDQKLRADKLFEDGRRYLAPPTVSAKQPASKPRVVVAKQPVRVVKPVVAKQPKKDPGSDPEPGDDDVYKKRR